MPQNYESPGGAGSPFGVRPETSPSAPDGGAQGAASQARAAQGKAAYQTPASSLQGETYRQQPQQAQQAQQPQQPTASVPMAPIAYAVPPKKSSRGWIVALVAVLCLFVLGILCVRSCSDALQGAAGMSSASPAGDAVAVIDLDGAIQYDESACSPEGLKSLLDQAADDEGTKAVVLRVNSGGGTATAGEEMAAYVRDFSKPIVVSSASINASAAYEISSQADYIYVAKSTEIGSIGTALEISDLSGLLEMLGVDIEVIASADSKDSSYGYRPLSDEEREYYQRMVDQINGVFIDNVAAGRGMSLDDVKALATGLVFTGLDAVENGLADEVGTLEDAIDKAAELAGVSEYTSYDLDFYSGYDLSDFYYLLGGRAGACSSQPLLSSRS